LVVVIVSNREEEGKKTGRYGRKMARTHVPAMIGTSFKPASSKAFLDSTMRDVLSSLVR
jgi:hypothetical protein